MTIAQLRAALEARHLQPQVIDSLLATYVVDPDRVKRHQQNVRKHVPYWQFEGDWFIDNGRQLVLSEEVTAA